MANSTTTTRKARTVRHGHTNRWKVALDTYRDGRLVDTQTIAGSTGTRQAANACRDRWNASV